MEAGSGRVLVVDLDGAVDGRMVDDAAGERLVGVLAKIEVHAEPRCDLRQIARRGQHVGKASRPFDAALARGESRLREERGRVAVLR